MIKKEYICPKGKESMVVIEDLNTKIQEGATIILGFAGAGLIGTIVTNALVEQMPDVYYIVSGKSPRYNVDHSVVFRKGKMVHDPHPDNTGILKSFWDYTFLIPDKYNIKEELC